MNDMASLGNWALIDIETTGIDPTYDQIIDIGFLQFEGTKLIKTYSSLVRTDVKLSKFIEKLTGINQDMVTNAPIWKHSEEELLELDGNYLLAHNAPFEKMYLEKYFDGIDEGQNRETYQDSMYYLSLLFPERSTLNLESFIIDFGIADKELHRGYEDSVDLLKVITVATLIAKRDKDLTAFLHQTFMEFSSTEFWYKNFFALDESDIYEIAEQIDFDAKEKVDQYLVNFNQSSEFVDEMEDKVDLEFSGQNIQAIYRDEDRLKNLFEGYQYRKAQEDLSLRVGQAFNNGIHAIIQAPTGTGKTLGYMIPSALMAKRKKEPVLISTGTKTLQNQAVKKDIPGLHKILGLNKSQLKVIRLVGSSNHLCELIYRNEKAEDLMIQMDSFEDRFSSAYLEAVFFSNQRIKDYNNIITRENIPYSLKRRLSSLREKEEASAVNYKACSGNKCPFSQSCTYLQGWRKAKEADLLIGNHALLMSWPRTMEKPPYIVIDEAHKMENEATGAFSSQIQSKDVESIAKNLPQMVGPLYYLLGQEKNPDEALAKKVRDEIQEQVGMLRDHVGPLFDNIERYARKLPNFTDLYWNEIKLLGTEKASNAVEASIYNHLESLKFIFENVYKLLEPFTKRWELSDLENDDNKVTAWTTLESTISNVEDTYLTLMSLLNSSDDLANTIKYHDEFGYTLESAPINIGKLIYENILKDTESVIFTSATLGNENGSSGMPAIEWMTGYSYLESTKRFKSGMFLQNNYDYEKNARVFLAQDTPPLYDQKFIPFIMENLIPLIRSLGGRTLLLFSSRMRFEKANEYLLNEFEGELPLFIQGMGNNIVEEFKQTENGILVGMESFGEGIDIPGRSLELVYVDKIPDLRREYIIDKRRQFYEREFGNEFNDYFLANRTRSLHQKLGRLIRRETDRGGILITDSRTSRWKSRTLGTFKELMKPYDIQFLPMAEACKSLESFIKR
jgi:ATP-dependent DNA helicase DinG